MVEIKTHDYYDMPDDNYMVIKHISKISSEAIYRLFIVDITTVGYAYRDLILRNIGHDCEQSQRTESLKVFTELAAVFGDYLGELWLLENKLNYPEADTIYIPMSVATHVYEFLYEKKYYYRWNCIFDGFDMIYDEMWPFKIMENYNSYKNGNGTVAAQNSWDNLGYSCDLCRCEVRYFEFMWHCKNKSHQHDLCLSCIYSTFQQYKEMQSFLFEILQDVVNQDIIQDIVSCCVGKVHKFDL